MLFLSWLRIGTSNRAPRARAQLRPAAPRFRPQLEALEDRYLPSTLTVTTTADSGPGSLRADIAAAQSGDTIVFASSLNGQTITLTSGVLDINKNLTIQGPGASQLTVSANYTQVFKVEATDQVSLSGLTISNGSTTGQGGGIGNYGNLTISACTLSHNYALNGGAIYNEVGATLTLSSSTVSGNKAGNWGGGIDNYGNLTMTGSTVDHNTAVYGGGILNAGLAKVNSSTLSGNSAFGGDNNGYGGAIYNAGTMSLLASTVTGNSANGVAGGIWDRGSLTISNQSDVCNNFVSSAYPPYESDLVVLDQTTLSMLTISKDSTVCGWRAKKK